MRALWLPEVVNAAGLRYSVESGWATRGREMTTIEGVVCFTADAIVLTRRGLVPIAEVTTDDHVWTHKARWRPVKSVGSRTAATHEISGQGHPGLVTTAEHPFLAYTKKPGRLTHAGWVPAIDMVGHYWCSPSVFEHAEAPEVATIGREHPVGMTQDLAWVLGYWVGNGSSATTHRNAHTNLYAPARRGPMVEERVRQAGLACSRQDRGSVQSISFSSKPLARWFRAEFGHLAHGKTMPAWALGMPEQWRRALLDGYLAADGGIVKPDGARAARVDAVTVSKRLAVGVRLLAHSLGISTALYLHHVPSTKQWGERASNQRDWWTVRLTESAPTQSHGRFVDGMFVAPCRQAGDTGRVETVYNMAVEEDESYVVDGLIVHNCHHTASAPGRNAPALGIVRDGRSDLAGPLSQLLLARDGLVIIVASGRANHAGTGSWDGVTDGNGRFLGIEAENNGTGEPWPAVQMDAYRRLVAALLKKMGRGAGRAAGHKEYGTPKGRKTDPSFDMNAFRSSVDRILRGHAITLPPEPPTKEDAMASAEYLDLARKLDTLAANVAKTDHVAWLAPRTVRPLGRAEVYLIAHEGTAVRRTWIRDGNILATLQRIYPFVLGVETWDLIDVLGVQLVGDESPGLVKDMEAGTVPKFTGPVLP